MLFRDTVEESDLAVQPDSGRARGLSSRGAQVYQTLIERIRSGELKPGTRLLEEDISALLGVSRTPVREGLARLQARGLVEAGAGGLVIPELHRQQIMELYAMRAVLEGAAARFAAENASAGDTAAMTHFCERFAANSGGPTEHARANRVFHESISEAAHNRYLARMLEDLNDSLALLPSTTFSVDGRVGQARVEHKAILDAIVSRRPDAAEEAARHHIEMARETRLRLLFASSQA